MAEIGVIGLSVMGQNLALNIASKGFRCAVYNRTVAKVTTTVERAKQEGDIPIDGHETLESFVQGLTVPRKMIILVQAGKPVDAVIDQLIPLLSAGDLIIDGGNEWFRNTEKRAEHVKPHGILYMGMGVSGGEEGARNGPSLMPGGSLEGYKLVEPILKKVAAQAKSGPCVAFMGTGGAGNYVKMIHNGIEYADMQLIGEAYDYLHRHGGFTNQELHVLFDSWNKSFLKSFLIEITAAIFAIKDDFNTGKELIDYIDDRAGSKGTGKWSSQESAERAAPCPAIGAALEMRNLSGMDAQRQTARQAFGKLEGFAPSKNLSSEEKKKLASQVEDALYCSKIMAYTQGLNLIRTTAKEEGWDLKLSSVAACWQGGCIIRAVFLDDVIKAFESNPDLPLLAAAEPFKSQIQSRHVSWRKLVASAMIDVGIPVQAFATSLSYFDALRADRLPTNLVQAQRDFFGAHEYRRTDRDGSFHTFWTDAHKATPESQIGAVKDRTAELVANATRTH